MKALAIVDLQGNLEKAKKLKGLLHNIGLVLIAGDITNSGSPKIAEEILSVFEEKKVFALPGNMDSEKILELLEKKGMSLHKRKEVFEGITFIGLGGGKPVNTFYRFNVGELEAKKNLSRLFEGVKGKTIVLSHCPPFGTKIDLCHAGNHLGLRALKEIIELKQPELVVCGHVHEAPGIEEIGKTKCINIGPAEEGNALIIDLKDLSFKKAKF